MLPELLPIFEQRVFWNPWHNIFKSPFNLTIHHTYQRPVMLFELLPFMWSVQ